MPDIEADGCRLSWSAQGPADAPALLLLNALGTTVDLWSPQIDPLADAFRVIRFDTRGHGRSDAPAGPYALDRLGRDALAVLDAAGAPRAHVCGVSLGGQTALWLAVHAPERVNGVVAANTGARIGTTALWNRRIRDAETLGMQALVEPAIARWFTPPVPTSRSGDRGPVPADAGRLLHRRLRRLLRRPPRRRPARRSAAHRAPHARDRRR